MAIIDIEIQSGITIVDQPRLVRGSGGTLYVIYQKGTANLWCAYSSDGGLTWAEVDSTSVGSLQSLAIDSTDKIHIVYKKSIYKVCYRTFSGVTWGAEEDIDTLNDSNFLVFGTNIAVDSSDLPHVVWSKHSNNGTYKQAWYSNRSGGTWAARTNLSTPGTDNLNLSIGIDSNNYIYVVWRNNDITIQYVKYTSFWTAAVQIGSSATSASFPSLAVDSADNVHVVWAYNNLLKYTKYTFLTDSWSAEATVTTIVTCNYPTISVDSSNNLNVIFQYINSPDDIYLIRNTGTWGTDSLLLDASGADSFTKPQIQSTVWPLIGAYHTNIATAGYQFTYINTVAGVNILRFYSSTDINFPAPQTATYSSEANGSLPSTDSNLSTLFTTANYVEVATVDNIFATQSATDQYSIFEFKNKGNSASDNIVVTWIGQSNIAPTTSPVLLQIYNRNSTTWETLDSNSSAGASANFSLSGSKTSSLTNYYNGSLWVSCRVYQNAV